MKTRSLACYEVAVNELRNTPKWDRKEFHAATMRAKRLIQACGNRRRLPKSLEEKVREAMK